VNDQVFRFSVIGGAVAVGVALFTLRFCGTEEIPPLPPAPVTTIEEAKETALEFGERGDVYAQRLRDDSRRFDLSEPATIKSMSEVFVHRSDREERVLSSGESATVLGLNLRVSVVDITRRTRQMELVIENRTDKYLAYRILTRPSKGTSGCTEKEITRHNAIVLAPGQIVRRSECIYRRGIRLEIGKVETIEVPPLSFYYLSAVPPIVIGAEARVAVGHRTPTGVTSCQTVLPAMVQRAMERGEVLWRDLIDFFARHTCTDYRFPHDYRAFDRDGAKKLPAPGSVR